MSAEVPLVLNRILLKKKYIICKLKKIEIFT